MMTDEMLIKQYMQCDSKTRAKHHLKTLELYDKAIEQLEVERKKVAEYKEALQAIFNASSNDEGKICKNDIKRIHSYAKEH